MPDRQDCFVLSERQRALGPVQTARLSVLSRKPADKTLWSLPVGGGHSRVFRDKSVTRSPGTGPNRNASRFLPSKRLLSSLCRVNLQASHRLCCQTATTIAWQHQEDLPSADSTGLLSRSASPQPPYPVTTESGTAVTPPELRFPTELRNQKVASSQRQRQDHPSGLQPNSICLLKLKF